MKTKRLLFAGAALMTAAALEALTIDNRVNPDGTPVLLPAVQKYEAGKGALALQQEFTVSAPAAADNEAGVLTELVKRHFPALPARRVAADGFCRLELAEKDVPESVDARISQSFREKPSIR